MHLPSSAGGIIGWTGLLHVERSDFAHFVATEDLSPYTRAAIPCYGIPTPSPRKSL